ncbi:WD40 repeat domain-containing protein [Frigoriglobus tundricola]|uniref:Uncharacterized protein n=1 Tax=Frigoriglobus tundricola TaxID=2774151 RepID=A0A6M5Z4J3_9BACT|nr:hypothetical protein [Frigoriglobus tundricola]QJX00976.1 hypothetical protein FTUN_8614 [Frigoriglobus tundricola]
MFTSLRFALVAVVMGTVMLAPARAQHPTTPQELQKIQDEIKALEEKRRILLVAEERKRAAVKAAEAKAAETKAAESKPTEMTWQFVVPSQPKAAAPTADAHAPLRALAKHSDPKVAALAKELLERLAAPAPAAPKGPKAEKSGAIQLYFEADGKGGFPLGILSGGDGKKGAEVIDIVLGTDGKGGPPRVVGSADVVIAAILPGQGEPAKATSSLKMAADGKTAAVVSADGTVVVFDVATGRELMRFPGKK